MIDSKAGSTLTQISCTPELKHELERHEVELGVVILNADAQCTPAQMVSLVKLCKTGLDILSDEESRRQREDDQLFRRMVAQDFLVSLLDPVDIAVPQPGVESVKFHHHLNLPPKVQRSKGRQPKHTRARIRGKKK